LLLISLTAFSLIKTKVLTIEAIKISDFITAAIAFASVFIGVVAAILSYRSLYFARLAEEGQLYIKMMERYSSEPMITSLQTLGKFKFYHKENVEEAMQKWYADLDNKVDAAIAIDKARHKVKYFYRDLMQLYQAGYFSEKLTKRILNAGGRYVFNDIVLPMERYRNQLEFEKEFFPFAIFLMKLIKYKPL
jgi:hypothetical protein